MLGVPERLAAFGAQTFLLIIIGLEQWLTNCKIE
jgi:hypothetical protein